MMDRRIDRTFFPFLLSLFLLISSALQGQFVQFEKVFGGKEKDRSFDVLQTKNEEYVIAGGTANSGPSGQAFIYRFDSLGDPLWQKGYGGSGTEVFYGIDTCPDQGFIATGITTSNDSNDHQIYVVRTDEQGNKIWSEGFGGKDWEKAELVKSLADTTYLIGGYTYSYGKGDRNLFLLKLDKSGDTLWTRSYGTAGEDDLHDIAVDTSGDLFLAGSSRDTGKSDTLRGYLIRTDGSGNVQWEEHFGMGYATPLHSIDRKGNGDLVTTAQYRDSSQAVNDLMILGIGSNGNLQWQQHYPQPGEDVLFDIVPSANDNGHLIAGYTTSLGAGGKDIRFFKTTNGGFFKWARTYGGSEGDLTRTVTLTQDSGYFTAGITESYGDSPANIYLLKTDTAGVSTGNVIVGRKEKKESSGPRGIFLRPNPVKKGNTVQLLFPNEKEEERRVVVRDLRGRILYSKSLKDPVKADVELRTERYNPGMLLITLEREKRTNITKKLIIR